MQKGKKHIDQSAQISALESKICELTDMVSIMQDIIIKQNRQINDIHKALFNHPKKTTQELYEDKKAQIKAELLMKNTKKR